MNWTLFSVWMALVAVVIIMVRVSQILDQLRRIENRINDVVLGRVRMGQEQFEQLKYQPWGEQVLELLAIIAQRDKP